MPVLSRAVKTIDDRHPVSQRHILRPREGHFNEFLLAFYWLSTPQKATDLEQRAMLRSMP